MVESAVCERAVTQGALNLKSLLIEDETLKQLPYSLAQKFCAIALSIESGILKIAVADPFCVDQLQTELQCAPLKLETVVAPKRQIEEAIRQHYRINQLPPAHDVEIVSPDESKRNPTERVNLEEMASSVGVVKSLNAILQLARDLKASDIHLEPQEHFLRVRLRIDGCLEERQILPAQTTMPLVSRIKIVSGMNIAEKRAPQDGRFTVKIKGELIDCRSSTYPTIYGEKVVIRLLIKNSLKKLEELGLFPEEVTQLKQCLSKPHGLILVTGPTGSGKSTTLYAALQLLNSIDRNILSIEDPVENEVGGINQAQVNTKANLTFANALRSMLRQDPDVIMVGEIRDAETAEMVMRAALTGHLVLSTLHTNNALGAVTRLLNLGIPPFLVSSSLVAVLAQRLARKNCQHCLQKIEVDPETLARIGITNPINTFSGTGCKQCRHTGYDSRIGLFELCVIDSPLKKIIEEGGKEEELIRQATKAHFKTMLVDARQKINEGLTSVSEVLRVSAEI